MTGTHQLLGNGGVEAHIYPLFLSVCMCVYMSLSLEYSINWRKRGAKGQLGSANLLREKLNVLSSPINTPLCGDNRGLLGLEIESLSDMTLSLEL